MKKQHFNLFSLSLAVVLLMSLTAGYVRAQAQAPNPGHEPLVIKQNSELEISVCDPKAGPFSIDITNRYFPLPVGNVWVLEGVDQGTKERLQITVLDETEKVANVTTRVVEERHWEDDQLVEVSRNFFVQAKDGTVCYYGEETDIYENGQVVSHEGAWRAGEGDPIARPGIVMPGDPKVGMAYAQEVAPGVAEDQAEIVSIGKTVTVPADTYRDTLRTDETTPLEPGLVESKVYAPGVGLIVDDKLKLEEVTQEEEED